MYIFYRYGKPMPWDGDIDFCLTKADVAKYVKYFEKTVRKTFQIKLNIFVKHFHFYKKNSSNSSTTPPYTSTLGRLTLKTTRRVEKNKENCFPVKLIFFSRKGHLKLCSAPKANVTAPLYGHQSNCSWPHIDLYYLRG